MTDNILKFVLLRPPGRTSERERRRRSIPLYENKLTPLAQQLANAGNAETARSSALEYIDKSPSFVSSTQSLRSAREILGLDQWVHTQHRLHIHGFDQAVSEQFETSSISQILERLDPDIDRLSDSLLALVVVGAFTRGREPIVRCLRICKMIERRADPCIRDQDLNLLRSAVIVVPRLGMTLKRQPQTEANRISEHDQEILDKQHELVERLNTAQGAIDELKSIYNAKLISARRGQETGTDATPEPASLTLVDLNQLRSSGDHPLLRTVTLPSEAPIVMRALELDRDKAARALSEVLVNARTDTISTFVTQRLSEISGAPYSPPYSEPIPSPSGETAGMVRRAGIGDLQVVRQRLRGYKLGEISHIENVMAGESFSRTFKRLDSNEVSFSSENERTETGERDLQTTSRFELKTDIEESVKENINVTAGVTVTTRGGLVDVAANAEFEYGYSSENVTKTATDYAREVVDRSVTRLQERTNERRSESSTRTIEDVSARSQANKGTDHSVGIYRWVDKLYEAQVVNYGRRMMLEVMVPEPAAFYQYARTRKSAVSSKGLLPPEPPMVLDSVTRQPRPLQVSDISERNYFLWVSRYNVSDVAQISSYFKYSTIAVDLSGDGTTPKITAKALEVGQLKVEPGYIATEYAISIGAARQTDDKIVIVLPQIGTWDLGFVELGTYGSRVLRTVAPESFENCDIPVSFVLGNTDAGAANVIVTSQRDISVDEAWRQTVFNAVMTKYERLKADFDDKVAAAEVQEGSRADSALNSSLSRQVEREELKKLAISIMTGQHFDRFDAMKGPDATHVFPQVNVSEAHEEGGEIALIEQAIEWQHMTYVFYPYFWGRKRRWLELLNEDGGGDPLFTKFLRAGSARVQLPVRPGFVEIVNFILANGIPRGGELPTGADLPHMEDSADLTVPYVSIVQEIQEQTGLDLEDGFGTVSVTQGSPLVTGDEDTAFLADDAGPTLGTANREIEIGGRTYRVSHVISANELVLSTPYVGETATNLPYRLGPRLVGTPWEIRLPTSLIILQGRETELAYGSDLTGTT